ncbi:hypothetical protein Taro_029425 [Colocasia esculenta]|uniref:Uncharacterized protein n=1 Tax=Colocasia esculenta TaxID=4460 RepID=A0A843VUU5_COLES|nr:hypothetical protein [Colocasia esculenta]
MAVPHLLLLIPAVLALFLLAALYVVCRPRPVKIPIKGRHVFITFASSGIGLAMARRAAAEGARVSILARDQAKLEAAREEIRRATGVEVAIYSADVRDREAVKKAVEAAGTIDVLICNQGVAVPKELVDQSMDEVMFQIDINLVAMISLVQDALPGMKKAAAEDGLPRSITFTTSQGGQLDLFDLPNLYDGDGAPVQVGYYAYSTYCATNFAVRGLAEALQMEVVNDNIRVSLLLPADTDTPGRAGDFKARPEIAHKIMSASGFLSADEVARKALRGIKAGDFVITITLEGFILSLATAGLSPQGSFLTAFAEIMFSGFMRFVGLCYLYVWYNIIEKHHAKVKSK